MQKPSNIMIIQSHERCTKATVEKIFRQEGRIYKPSTDKHNRMDEVISVTTA